MGDDKDIRFKLRNIHENSPQIASYKEEDIRGIHTQFSLSFDGIIEENLFRSIGLIKFISNEKEIVCYKYTLDIEVEQLSLYAVRESSKIHFDFPEEFFSIVIAETYCMGRGLLLKQLPEDLKTIYIQFGGYRKLLALIKEYPNGMNN